MTTMSVERRQEIGQEAAAASRDGASMAEINRILDQIPRRPSPQQQTPATPQTGVERGGGDDGRSSDSGSGGQKERVIYTGSSTPRSPEELTRLITEVANEYSVTLSTDLKRDLRALKGELNKALSRIPKGRERDAAYERYSPWLDRKPGQYHGPSNLAATRFRDAFDAMEAAGANIPQGQNWSPAYLEARAELHRAWRGLTDEQRTQYQGQYNRAIGRQGNDYVRERMVSGSKDPLDPTAGSLIPWTIRDRLYRDPEYNAHVSEFQRNQAARERFIKDRTNDVDGWSLTDAQNLLQFDQTFADYWRDKGSPTLYDATGKAINPVDWWSGHVTQGNAQVNTMRDALATSSRPTNPWSDLREVSAIADRAKFGTTTIGGVEYIAGRTGDDGRNYILIDYKGEPRMVPQYTQYHGVRPNPWEPTSHDIALLNSLAQTHGTTTGADGLTYINLPAGYSGPMDNTGRRFTPIVTRPDIGPIGSIDEEGPIGTGRVFSSRDVIVTRPDIGPIGSIDEEGPIGTGNVYTTRRVGTDLNNFAGFDPIYNNAIAEIRNSPVFARMKAGGQGWSPLAKVTLQDGSVITYNELAQRMIINDDLTRANQIVVQAYNQARTNDGYGGDSRQADPVLFRELLAASLQRVGHQLSTPAQVYIAHYLGRATTDVGKQKANEVPGGMRYGRTADGQLVYGDISNPTATNDPVRMEIARLTAESQKARDDFGAIMPSVAGRTGWSKNNPRFDYRLSGIGWVMGPDGKPTPVDIPGKGTGPGEWMNHPVGRFILGGVTKVADLTPEQLRRLKHWADIDWQLTQLTTVPGANPYGIQNRGSVAEVTGADNRFQRALDKPLSVGGITLGSTADMLFPPTSQTATHKAPQRVDTPGGAHTTIYEITGNRWKDPRTGEWVQSPGTGERFIQDFPYTLATPLMFTGIGSLIKGGVTSARALSTVGRATAQTGRAAAQAFPGAAYGRGLYAPVFDLANTVRPRVIPVISGTGVQLAKEIPSNTIEGGLELGWDWGSNAGPDWRAESIQSGTEAGLEALFPAPGRRTHILHNGQYIPMGNIQVQQTGINTPDDSPYAFILPDGTRLSVDSVSESNRQQVRDYLDLVAAKVNLAAAQQEVQRFRGQQDLTREILAGDLSTYSPSEAQALEADLRMDVVKGSRALARTPNYAAQRVARAGAAPNREVRVPQPQVVTMAATQVAPVSARSVQAPTVDIPQTRHLARWTENPVFDKSTPEGRIASTHQNYQWLMNEGVNRAERRRAERQAQREGMADVRGDNLRAWQARQQEWYEADVAPRQAPSADALTRSTGPSVNLPRWLQNAIATGLISGSVVFGTAGPALSSYNYPGATQSQQTRLQADSYGDLGVGYIPETERLVVQGAGDTTARSETATPVAPVVPQVTPQPAPKPPPSLIFAQNEEEDKKKAAGLFTLDNINPRELLRKGGVEALRRAYHIAFTAAFREQFANQGMSERQIYQMALQAANTAANNAVNAFAKEGRGSTAVTPQGDALTAGGPAVATQQQAVTHTGLTLAQALARQAVQQAWEAARTPATGTQVAPTVAEAPTPTVMQQQTPTFAASTTPNWLVQQQQQLTPASQQTMTPTAQQTMTPTAATTVSPTVTPAVSPVVSPVVSPTPVLSIVTTPQPNVIPTVQSNLQPIVEPVVYGQLAEPTPERKKSRARSRGSTKKNRRELVEAIRRKDDMSGRYPSHVAHIERRLVVKDLDSDTMLSIPQRVTPSQVIATDNTPPPRGKQEAGHRGYDPIGKRPRPYNVGERWTKVTPAGVKAPRVKKTKSKGKFIPLVARRRR